jgi:SNF2 family DNA or RNA helicase
MAKVGAEISRDGKKIEIRFPFDMEIVNKVKSVSGARFVNKEKSTDGRPHWTIPLELEAAKRLRRVLGDDLALGPQLRTWAKERTGNERKLIRMALATDSQLATLPTRLPSLYSSLRPYQRAGVAFGAHASNPLIADQPGLGKTRQMIGTVFEYGNEHGAHLVIAPLTSLVTVWQRELEELQDLPVLVAVGDRSEREATVEAAQLLYEEGTPFWLVINPAMVQLRRIENSADPSGPPLERYRFPGLETIHWNNIILDEIHKAGFRDLNTLTAKGIFGLKGDRRIGMSGTPIGGKPINLWLLLHWLNPEEFSSKWRFAEEWLDIEETRYGKNIGRIRKGMEDEFYRAMTPYMLRRTKTEVLPELPPKQQIDLWVEMDGQQAAQYRRFAELAEVTLSEQVKLSATSVLAEYTRLKQFAIAYQEVEFLEDGTWRPKPTTTSCKLDMLVDLLDDRDLLDPDDPGQEQVVVFSQFSQVIDMVYSHLLGLGVPVAKLTGATSLAARTALQNDFQAGALRVLCMTTTAGGVAITLDAADTVIFMDETWVPDDQEQASDRVHRASRIHQVTVYTIRTKDTIEDYIQRRVQGKQDINTMILDLRREGLKSFK